MEHIKDLDDIGFVGNPRCRYTEKDAKIFGAFFQTLRARRRELLREPTDEEVKQIIQDVQKSYRQEQRAKRKQTAFA